MLPQKRKAGILSEVLFWKTVRARKFHNIDFDRQRIIGNYIVDFYVKTLGLVIEIEGSNNSDKRTCDQIEQLFLDSLGLKLFRISDFDVKNNFVIVMKDLEFFIVDNFGKPKNL